MHIIIVMMSSNDSIHQVPAQHTLKSKVQSLKFDKTCPRKLKAFFEREWPEVSRMERRAEKKQNEWGEHIIMSTSQTTSLPATPMFTSQITSLPSGTAMFTSQTTYLPANTMFTSQTASLPSEPTTYTSLPSEQATQHANQPTCWPL